MLRLQGMMQYIISENQAAFVQGRHIQDNILEAHELIHSLKSKKDCSEKYIAIKTDISKAYDRVEWKFLETTMRKLSFAEVVIGWIMTCVSTVSYSILVNGSPFGHITPSRGIRKGDPLSPFIFLLCSEVLSQMFKILEQANKFQGTKVARRCPSVSHLLFADDSLFLYKASLSDCQHVASLLREYEHISGHQVSLEKSSIIFRMMMDQKRRRIQSILRIHKVGGGGKYLGLPEQFGRNKIEVFEDMVSDIKDTTSGCIISFYPQLKRRF